MSYESALQAAGAKILCFESFGSYQGDWLAKVEHEGEVKWIQGCYGSCSGCDAFEAEFGWDDATPEKLAEFGRPYLSGGMSQDEAEKFAERNIEWDSDAKPMLDFVRNNKI